MTPEERFQKIEEHLMVTAEMMLRSDRRWDDKFAGHDARLTRLEEVVASLAAAEKKLFRALDKLADAHQGTDARLEAVSEKLDELAGGQKVTRAMMDALINNIDRFVRGQAGNGRGGPRGRKRGKGEE
jgi:hypothetical protein